MKKFLLVHDARLPPELAGFPAMPADEFVEKETDPEGRMEGAAIINLCRNFQYLGRGYYVSLIADARHHEVFPTLEMMEELSNPYAYFRVLRELGLDTIDYRMVPGRKRALPSVLVINKEDVAGHERGIALVRSPGSQLSYTTPPTMLSYREITGVLGHTIDPKHAGDVAAIFRAYRFPILRIRIYDDGKESRIGQVYAGSLKDLTPEELGLFAQQLRDPRFLEPDKAETKPRHDRIACLWDVNDPFSPSALDTLERMEGIAHRKGIQFELITDDDLNRLAEYDALFIRTVTGLDKRSFVFAQTAEAMGIPVIDDTQSIIKCSNKVYLHEVFKRHGVPTPKTMTVTRNTSKQEVTAFGFPIILKVPDGTFSTAVEKASDWAGFEAVSKKMFRSSPLLIGQEFLPTDFDWRVGILDNKILFTVKYFMASGHWQIAANDDKGGRRYGPVEAVKKEDAPEEVRRVALASAALIGRGLYGVDVKQLADGRAVVIEVNDNPNIDWEVEDGAEGDAIFEALIDHFIRLMEEGQEEGE